MEKTFSLLILGMIDYEKFESYLKNNTSEDIKKQNEYKGMLETLQKNTKYLNFEEDRSFCNYKSN